MTRMTILSVTVAVQHGDAMKAVEIAGAFDPVLNAEHARAVGSAIGVMVADNLERRIRFGEDLARAA
jgi:hypothetical protein